jgi:hypothetical protein
VGSVFAACLCGHEHEATTTTSLSSRTSCLLQKPFLQLADRLMVAWSYPWADSRARRKPKTENLLLENRDFTPRVNPRPSPPISSMLFFVPFKSPSNFGAKSSTCPVHNSWLLVCVLHTLVCCRWYKSSVRLLLPSWHRGYAKAPRVPLGRCNRRAISLLGSKQVAKVASTMGYQQRQAG